MKTKLNNSQLAANYSAEAAMHSIIARKAWGEVARMYLADLKRDKIGADSILISAACAFLAVEQNKPYAWAVKQFNERTDAYKLARMAVGRAVKPFLPAKQVVAKHKAASITSLIKADPKLAALIDYLLEHPRSISTCYEALDVEYVSPAQSKKAA
jgi:hypothetical protein